MGNHAMELRNHVDECEVCGPASEEQKQGSTFAEILRFCCEEGAKLRARYYAGWEYATSPDKPFACSCRCECSSHVHKKIGLETVPVWCESCEALAEDGQKPHCLGYISKKFVFPVIRDKDGNPKTFPKLISEDLLSAPEDTKALFSDVALHMATVVSAASLGEEFASGTVEGMIDTVEGILSASIGTGKESLCADIVIDKLRKLGVPDEVIERAQSFADRGKEG
jgi:hypothetical protein